MIMEIEMFRTLFSEVMADVERADPEQLLAEIAVFDEFEMGEVFGVPDAPSFDVFDSRIKRAVGITWHFEDNMEDVYFIDCPVISDASNDPVYKIAA